MPLFHLIIQNLAGTQARCYVEAEVSGKATRIQCVSATLNCDSTLRTILKGIGAICHGESTISGTANVAHSAVATASAETVIEAHATIKNSLGVVISAEPDMFGQATKIVAISASLKNYSRITARTRLEKHYVEPPARPSIDWHNTMGGGMAITGSKPSAVALTFIRGKHIYSEVKKKKKNLKVKLVGMAYEIENGKNISVKLINVSTQRAKLEINMKSLTRDKPKVKTYGKIHIKQKQVRDIQVPL